MATRETTPAIEPETYHRITSYLRDALAHPGPITLSPMEVAEAVDCTATDAHDALFAIHKQHVWLEDAGHGLYQIMDGVEA